MRFPIITIPAVAGLAALAFTACEGTTSVTPTDGIVYGPSQQLGNGIARTYYEMRDNLPVALGVALSETALQGLPAPDGAPHGAGQLLVMPPGNPTPFQFLELNWNPGGHEPPGIYDRPHFDFHFYRVPQSVRASIDPADSAFQRKAAKFPEAAFIPARYVAPAPEAVPFMGVHWIDPTSPEFTGQGFSRTFIYGTWDGLLIFAEPMITKAFLETKPNVTIPIPMAERYQTAGVYPSAYSIRWDEASRQYFVALTGLTRKS